MKGDRNIDNKHVEWPSTLLLTKKMQIKALMRYHFIFTEMTKIKKTKKPKC